MSGGVARGLGHWEAMALRASAGNTALHLAAKAGDAAAVRAAVKRCSGPQAGSIWGLVTARNRHGDSPLMFACAAGGVGCCAAIIKAALDAPPDASELERWAEAQRPVESASLEGALFSVPNAEGITPLICCAMATAHSRRTAKESWASAKMLLCHGGAVSLDIQDKHGCTALHYAARSGCKALVQLLIEYKAKPCIRSKAGRTPLDESQRGKEETELRLYEFLKVDSNMQEIFYPYMPVGPGQPSRNQERFKQMLSDPEIRDKIEQQLRKLLLQQGDPNATPRDPTKGPDPQVRHAFDMFHLFGRLQRTAAILETAAGDVHKRAEALQNELISSEQEQHACQRAHGAQAHQGPGRKQRKNKGAPAGKEGGERGAERSQEESSSGEAFRLSTPRSPEDIHMHASTAENRQSNWVEATSGAWTRVGPHERKTTKERGIRSSGDSLPVVFQPLSNGEDDAHAADFGVKGSADNFVSEWEELQKTFIHDHAEVQCLGIELPDVIRMLTRSVPVQPSSSQLDGMEEIFKAGLDRITEIRLERATDLGRQALVEELRANGWEQAFGQYSSKPSGV